MLSAVFLTTSYTRNIDTLYEITLTYLVPNQQKQGTERAHISQKQKTKKDKNVTMK